VIILSNQYLKRNICIGLIDGITIPLALAAGLSAIAEQSHTVGIACLAVGIAGSITMGVGGYMEAKKYEAENNSLNAALTIGASYLIGSTIVGLPYWFATSPLQALPASLALSFILLFGAGFTESGLHQANSWWGGTRVLLTAMIAAGAAWFVAGLFF